MSKQNKAKQWREEEEGLKRGRVPRSGGRGPFVTEVPPRNRFSRDASVRYCGRPAVVVEVVPPQGRPTVSGLEVHSMRAMESYVVQFEQGGQVKHAWPACHELEA